MFPRILDHTLFAQYLDKDEKIVYVAHKHPVLLIKDFLLFSFWGLFIPWFVYASNPIYIWLAATILFIAWIKFLYVFVIWFFDCWIITNRSIIDVVWKSMFDRKSIRYDFANFEGITTEVTGFFHTIIRMGDVMLIRFIDTNQVKLSNAAFPSLIETKVLKAKAEFQKDMHQQKNNNQKFISDMISDMVSEYAGKRGIVLDE